MNAKEMFEYEGYELFERNKKHLIYVHTESSITIMFYFDFKQYVIGEQKDILENHQKGDLVAVAIEDHKAINKQLEELGWL